MENAPEKKETFFEFLRFVILATAIVVPIRLFIAQPFVVSGASMVPTFESGHYLIIDELSYRFTEPNRGDVVVFRFPLESGKFLIKRIAGLPDETIEIRDDTVTIINSEHPEGFLWQQGKLTTSNRKAEQTVKLGENEFFVLGDNRDESADSRLWGALPRRYITGKPFVRLFPLSQIGFFPGQWEASPLAGEN